MFGGRQFFLGLLLGGLGLAFAQTREGRQLLDKCAQAFVLPQQPQTNAPEKTQAVAVVSNAKEDKQNDA